MDGTLIETAQIFVKTTVGDIVLLSTADKVDKWIDHNKIAPHTLKMETDNAATCKCSCIERILIYMPLLLVIFWRVHMGNSLSIWDTMVITVQLMFLKSRLNKGDLWYYNIDQFYSDICVTVDIIDEV